MISKCLLNNQIICINKQPWHQQLLTAESSRVGVVWERRALHRYRYRYTNTAAGCTKSMSKPAGFDGLWKGRTWGSVKERIANRESPLDWRHMHWVPKYLLYCTSNISPLICVHPTGFQLWRLLLGGSKGTKTGWGQDWRTGGLEIQE